MRLPHEVLARVRGPLAAALIGCSSPPAEAPAIEPVAEPAGVTATPPLDPVAYDLDAETERLERADRVLASAEARRARRIEAEEEEARRRARERALLAGPGPGHHWVHAACGRG